MNLLDSADARPVHFVGIAGAGMSALAELFTRRGVRVTGCDMHPEAASDLARSGIPVQEGHSPEHASVSRALVISSAIPRDHPELLRARELKLPVVRRAEALWEAVSVGRVIGVAGTHGKTTTTVMTTEALESAGVLPTGIAGGRVAAWQGNISRGSDKVFVVEADEYDRSFLALRCEIAVVTNIEADHLDIYRDLDDIRNAFRQFIFPARTVVLCAEDPVASTLEPSRTASVIRYGIDAPGADLVASGVSQSDGGHEFDVVYRSERLARLRIRVPGRHNVLNALAAVGAGLALGVEVRAMARGLAQFGGVERRFQRLGEVKGVAVVDDYAHHPTEIKATLAAAREAFPGRRLVAAFQPHLFSRTRDFAADFGRELARADAVFLAEIYPARERPIPEVTSGLVADALHRSGGNLVWRGERPGLADALAAWVKAGDVVLTIGAGDITHTAPELLSRLGRGGEA